ncbi:MAG: 23S rRNA (adenine(2503)-C(2))-methyltransferase RlmN, partial [Planctomycetes bacterium]|nr:23S rRNA (adenine(2503)-C(2))-methyltransferase RlmN [Planctomycetota bacterium]
MNKINLKSLTHSEMVKFVESIDCKKYRAKQLMHWINTKYASDINEMTDLSKDLRTQLNDRAYLSDFKLRQTQESTDGTRKFLFVLEDGQTIESVLIPDGEQRLT